MQAKNHRLFAAFVFVALLLLTSAATFAQDSTPPSPQAMMKPGPPVVYKGISFPQLPYASHWVTVKGSKMHYIEAGDPKADPILLIHGNGSWSYLWRNVIPYLEPHGHVIAFDLIGMGRSDKPAIGYSYNDHIAYLEGFLDALRLKNVTLVIHDWGSALGFDYAARHEGNVKGIVFMEAMVPPMFPAHMAALPPEMKQMFTAFRTPGVGEEMVLNQNFLIEGVLASPLGVMRGLSQEELNAYRAPYPNPKDRVPLLRWPREIPFDGQPADVAKVVDSYIAWMTMQTKVPMLYVYDEPGAIAGKATAEWARQNLKNTEVAFVGQGGHYLQEDQPDAIGKAIANWLARGRGVGAHSN